MDQMSVIPFIGVVDVLKNRGLERLTILTRPP